MKLNNSYFTWYDISLEIEVEVEQCIVFILGKSFGLHLISLFIWMFLNVFQFITVDNDKDDLTYL